MNSKTSNNTISTTPQYISEIRFKGNIETRSYLSNLPIIKFLTKNENLRLNKNVTFFVGENGTGKSTLLEAIAVAYGFNPEGGTVNFNFSTNATHSDLWKNLTLVKRGYPKDGFFLRAESLYNVATNIDELDSIPSYGGKIISSYGGISLHNQSHGESFLSIVKNRFGGNGLYILDEPEAALSPMKLMTLMVRINDLVKDNSQFIIATHSPILMTFPDSEIIEFTQNGISRVEYRETEHYRITKSFLDDPERMLSYLLEK